jgi:hypothetical protein
MPVSVIEIDKFQPLAQFLLVKRPRRFICYVLIDLCMNVFVLLFAHRGCEINGWVLGADICRLDLWQKVPWALATRMCQCVHMAEQEFIDSSFLHLIFFLNVCDWEYRLLASHAFVPLRCLAMIVKHLWWTDRHCTVLEKCYFIKWKGTFALSYDSLSCRGQIDWKDSFRAEECRVDVSYFDSWCIKVLSSWYWITDCVYSWFVLPKLFL